MGYIAKDGSYYEGNQQYGDIEVPQRPNPTDTWIKGDWVAFQPSLQERKEDIITSLEAEYEAAKSAPIEYLNTTFQADKVSRETILEVLVAAGFTMPLGYEWRDINDAKVNVEGDKLHGLSTAILNRGYPLFWEKSAKKDAINACETVEELDLYLNPPPPVVEPVVPVEPLVAEPPIDPPVTPV